LSRFPYGKENVVESPLCSRELCQQYLLPGKAHKCEKFVTFHRLAGGEKPESFSFLFAETRDEILKDAIFCPPGPGERGRVNSRWGVLSGFLWLRGASNRSNHTLVVFTAVRLFITRADCLKWFDNRSQLGHVIALAVQVPVRSAPMLNSVASFTTTQQWDRVMQSLDSST
jgi:hypothetical protein